MTDDKLKRIKELENKLSYLVNDTMTTEQKIKSLSDAYWEANNSGYGDAMANKRVLRARDEFRYNEFIEARSYNADFDSLGNYLAFICFHY